MKRSWRPPAERPPEPPHFFEFLTQEEWKLVFSIAFLETTDSFGSSFGTARYATPGEEGPTGDWIELFQRAIRFLVFEHGYAFTALTAHRDGAIVSPGPVCQGNKAYFVLLRDGGLPDLERAFRTAIEEGEAAGLPTEPLREALVQVRRDRGLAALQSDPELERERERLREEALREIGVVRGPEAVH